MQWTVYKPGQGYWTRVLSAIGAGTLVLCGVAWIWSELAGTGFTLDDTRAVTLTAAPGGLRGLGLDVPPDADPEQDGGLQVVITGSQTPAGEADVKDGDVITHIANAPVTDRTSAEAKLAQIPAGGPVTIELLHHEDITLYVQAVAAAVIILGFGALLWYVLNKPNIVDFMIATEAEMRKVNWPTRKEIGGSTWIVICGTLMMALLLFVVDICFAKLFKSIGILDI